MGKSEKKSKRSPSSGPGFGSDSFTTFVCSILVIYVAFKFATDLGQPRIPFEKLMHAPIMQQQNSVTKNALIIAPELCKPMPNTEIGGDGLASSSLGGDLFRRDTEMDCCQACIQHTGAPHRCNIWVFNPETKACWLKYSALRPEVPKGFNQAPTVPWTSGSIYSYGPNYIEEPGKHNTCIHTIVTSDGSEYMNWQTKILYESYKKVSDDNALMSMFTRILHSRYDDDLMQYVSTVRIEPDIDYPYFRVAERANVFRKWVMNSALNTCSHILLVEPDYIFFKQPDPALYLPNHGNAVGFYYPFINPTTPENEPIIKKYFDRPELVPSTGPSPILMTYNDFTYLAPVWDKLNLEFEQDEELKNKFGITRDMYSFSVAAAKLGLNVVTEHTPYNPLTVQLPADKFLGRSFIFHYSWGIDIIKDGFIIFSFDKRSYQLKQLSKVEKNMLAKYELPDFEVGMSLQNNVSITEEMYGMIRIMVYEFNAAVGGFAPTPPKGG